MTDQRLTDDEREQAAQSVRDALEKTQVFDFVDAYELAVELRKRGWRWGGNEDHGEQLEEIEREAHYD